MAQMNLEGFGYNEFVTVTGAKTLAAADSGIIQNFTATATCTLPLSAPGLDYLIRVGKEGITLTIAPGSTDGITGGNPAVVAVNKAIIFTNQPAGSWVELSAGTSASLTGWVIRRQNGSFTRQP